MATKPQPHPNRKEIARYLLSRGTTELDSPGAARAAAAGAGAPKPALAYPDGLAPAAAPLATAPSKAKKLPAADVVVVTWTVDELAALAQVITPKVNGSHWYPYARNFVAYKPNIRLHAPAANSQRLGSYMPTTIGNLKVLAMKSELHLNQDGVSTGDGTATLPVKDFFTQIIEETGASLIITTGTAGATINEFGLGDVVVTRAARFRCTQEFRNEPFNNTTFKSKWTVPRTHLQWATDQFAVFSPKLAQPPVGPPTTLYKGEDTLQAPPDNSPAIRLDGRDFAANKPILTTDFFEYGTTANDLGRFGCGVEMGDAALGLACSEMANPPRWLVIRNMSDPVINGALPTDEYLLNEQTTWAVAYYAAYGQYTSIMSALTCWAVIAGLE